MDQATYTRQHHLHQNIEVDATFSRNILGHCRPIAFRNTSGREVRISEIGLVHPKYDGLKTIFAFDVTDGTTDYRLCLDSENLNWYLEFEGDADA
ncbi:hypothetical protein IJ102_02605 [Candidatus Saccharibacteria bacterium]|nr:hypothetical protein [Candidatus Saccharibacteria bacterium]